MTQQEKVNDHKMSMMNNC